MEILYKCSYLNGAVYHIYKHSGVFRFDEKSFYLYGERETPLSCVDLPQ